MTVHVDKNNPQIIVVSNRDAEGVLHKMATLQVTYALSGGAEVATIGVTPESIAAVGGTTSAVTLTFD